MLPPKSKYILKMPCKVKWHSKYIRVLLIAIYGKYRLIKIIRDRDTKLFNIAWREYTDSQMKSMNMRYTDENFKEWLEYFANQNDIKT